MFVPEDFNKKAKRVRLVFFRDGSCDLLVEGVRILKLKEDRIYLCKYVSTQVTGLATGCNSEALVEIEE